MALETSPPTLTLTKKPSPTAPAAKFTGIAFLQYATEAAAKAAAAKGTFTLGSYQCCPGPCRVSILPRRTYYPGGGGQRIKHRTDKNKIRIKMLATIGSRIFTPF